MLDRDGVLHMIFYQGRCLAGDIEYVWAQGEREISLRLFA